MEPETAEAVGERQDQELEGHKGNYFAIDRWKPQNPILRPLWGIVGIRGGRMSRISDAKRRRIRESREPRRVMERVLCRKLLRIEEVHHINGDKRDNRAENLAVVRHAEHVHIHKAIFEERKQRLGLEAGEPNPGIPDGTALRAEDGGRPSGPLLQVPHRSAGGTTGESC